MADDALLRRRARIVLFLLLGVLFLDIARYIYRDGDFIGYWEVGELVLSGKHPYWDAREYISNWPPFFTLLCVPIALLVRIDRTLAGVLWMLAIVVCTWASWKLAIRMVYGRRLALTAGEGTIGLVSAAFLVPLLLQARLVLTNLERLQINIMILVAMLAAARLLAMKRQGAAGALIGFVAAIKVLPVLLVPYLMYKRWWRAAGFALGTGAVCSLLPMVVYGPSRFVEYVGAWITNVTGELPVREGNQSLYAMVERYLNLRSDLLAPGTTDSWVASHDPVVSLITYAVLGGVVVLAVRACRPRDTDPASVTSAVEFSIVLSLVALSSPLSWHHYFVFLLPAHVVLWRLARSRTQLPSAARRTVMAVLTVQFALMCITSRSLVGSTVAYMSQRLSAMTIAGLTVLGGLIYARRQLGEASLMASDPAGSPQKDVVCDADLVNEGVRPPAARTSPLRETRS